MVIGGLKPDTTYSITVAAYTTKGDGARSKPKLVVTKGAGQYMDNHLFVGLFTGPLFVQRMLFQPAKDTLLKRSSPLSAYC